MTSTADRTTLFHALHQQPPLALPNAWDVASALIVEAAGAKAVATTSAGVAWSLGAPDGDALDRELAIDLVARIAKAVSIPVTADIESGFGEDAKEVGETARAVVAAGASGVNIEDGHGGSIRDVQEQKERLAAAREAAPELFINARTDVYLRGVGAPEDRLQLAIDRAKAYLEAGASGIFVPGVYDLDVIKTLAENIDAPLNVLAGPGAPAVHELATAGAARISVGTALASAAYAVAKKAAEELLTKGTYDSTNEGLGYGELNALFSK
ncbi:isocitrate lyase/phosphoenolpyruvate mutase family protein [Lentzea sp. BCCO 10_0856]|uniref:Isocitrate lyase/phosphoenolpyruvate mutase family protein n=1 Tax=Lentzea miocenica TaxID=3095431 RepID=A0ABU4SYL0_9PSEU|nr:isocitrate lyase/phosphoenolpyruvate mutase family protein [Lentzea sp. BCCO 10_0856]MDX8030818.1 isocitrate lyase/phosphoenolpyruvate mutase family protein [Lentzea sp. BCCO 10_0856]